MKCYMGSYYINNLLLCYVAGTHIDVRIKLHSNASYTFINLTWTLPVNNGSMNLETPEGFEIYYHPENNLNDGKYLGFCYQKPGPFRIYTLGRSILSLGVVTHFYLP